MDRRRILLERLQQHFDSFLLWLSRNRRAAEESGRLAAEHVLAEHHLDRVTQCYLDLLKYPELRLAAH